MMQYWDGFMNWPINSDWRCEICGNGPLLEWGFQHARCRCIQCHTQYMMREITDGKYGPRLAVPICQLKAEYKAPAQWLWNTRHLPLSSLTDEDWDVAMKAVGTVKEEAQA